MEFKSIKDKEAIEHFKKILKKLKPEQLKKKYMIDKEVVSAKDILKRMEKGDNIGKTALYAQKLYMNWLKDKNWHKKIEKKIDENEESSRLSKKKDDFLMVVSRPTNDGLDEFQGHFEDIVVIPAREGKFNLKPEVVDLLGKEATKKNIINYCSKPDFTYFTTITHGGPDCITAQDLEIAFLVEDDETKQICENHHFNFIACSSGEVLAPWMVINCAKHIHAYSRVLVFPLGVDAYEFVYAATTVDRELLNGKTNFRAHQKCKYELFKLARKEYEEKNYLGAMFMIFDGFIKQRYGRPFSKLEKPTAPPEKTIHVGKIQMDIESQRVWVFNKLRGIANVKVLDQSDKPVRGATVSGIWSGNAINSSSEITKTDGQAVLLSNWYWSRRGRFTYTVKDIRHKDMTYVSEENRQTRGTITR